MRLPFSLVFGLLLALSAASAQAACLGVPENKVWGHVSNDAIARYVETQFNGNWSAYLKKWENRLERVEEIAAKDGMIVFHNSGLWLREKALRKYVKDVRERLTATQCMAAASTAGHVPGAALVGIPVADGGS